LKGGKHVVVDDDAIETLRDEVMHSFEHSVVGQAPGLRDAFVRPLQVRASQSSRLRSNPACLRRSRKRISVLQPTSAACIGHDLSNVILWQTFSVVADTFCSSLSHIASPCRTCVPSIIDLHVVLAYPASSICMFYLCCQRSELACVL
jgi:hypothetical protein